jgi:hypothetical protein
MARELARESTTEPTGTDAVGRRPLLGLCATVFGAVLAWSGLSRVEASPGGTITVTSADPSASNYEITVTGVVAPDGAATDHVDPGTSVEDAIGDGVHTYRFDGEVTNLVTTGDTLVYVDGDRVA